MIVECGFCGRDVEDTNEALENCPDCKDTDLCGECIDDHECDPASCIGYHDRPMTQADQLAYDAYMTREAAFVAAAMGGAQ